MGCGASVPAAPALPSPTLSSAESERIRSEYDALSAYAERHSRAPFSSPHVDKLRTFFQLFDRDGSGALTAADVAYVMRALLLEPTDGEVEERLRAADADGDGRVDLAEFMAMMAKHGGVAFGLTPLVAHVQSAELLTDTGRICASDLPQASCVEVSDHWE